MDLFATRASDKLLFYMFPSPESIHMHCKCTKLGLESVVMSLYVSSTEASFNGLKQIGSLFSGQVVVIAHLWPNHPKVPMLIKKRKNSLEFPYLKLLQIF